ncbi:MULTISPECIES: SDR family NAD(P)-dependent oxidoreductase [Aliiglaciecola]|uniref:SDR family NAD(P)-dependent oxidoreductase n=1 Tax=Aliiglaciecola TaxID=1406885 RepID=UPI001C097233|nr:MULTISPECIES: SDR family oxidoreductase [unclassified Aliiglaciecola]MBU2878982.1 SDR family oxidoreductase [Aliiglaciecola lipolytica]MDO6710683.1 SDR family oxidoreductase [Aliiglaciecola sp. 2_MG-2023]MDO6751909.1 SDR family oxidoreductase [Aliiglaciecola sp. 1_MG-2023]
MTEISLPKLPNMRLDGRRALVTGAGRGIGMAMAAGLAEVGAHVTLVARSQGEISAVAAAIVAAGGQAEAVCLDVTDLQQVEVFFEQRQGFDVLINNAGTNRPKGMMDVTEDDYDAVLNLNLKSAFFVAQACVKKMVASNIKGSLIHIGSQMGHVGGPNRSLYCASKWALEGMNKSLALDLASYGIRSNTIAPTFIETPLTKPFFEDPLFLRSVLSKIKLGRLGQVQDLMGAAVYLASDASSLVTGTSIVVDGGWTAD